MITITLPYPPSLREISLSRQRHATWQYKTDCKRLAVAQIKKSSFIRMALNDVIEKGQPIRLSLDFYPSKDGEKEAFTLGEVLITESLATALFLAEAVPEPIDSVNNLIVIEKKLHGDGCPFGGLVKVTILPAMNQGGERG